MLRKQLLDHHTQDADPNAFRWRGTEVSRLEGFTDAILGFAITLVVVSLDVPDTLDGLLRAMRGFVPFGLCFAYLVLIWHEHNVYFRRYGLNTRFILICNTALLFVVLMYVYPLKFLANYLVDGLIGLNTPGPADDGLSIPVLAQGQIATLMVVYGVGYAAIRAIILLLYGYAYSLRNTLELNSVERFDTLETIQGQAIRLGIGCAAVLVAALGGSSAGLASGLIFMSLFLILPIFHSIKGRQRHRYEVQPSMQPLP
ncbi:MAG: TMEM175 family protein [Caldilineaceae bacterium]